MRPEGEFGGSGRIRSSVFTAAVSVFLAAFVLGAYQSVVVDGQLPRLGLNYNWWFRLLEERGEKERIVDQWAMVSVLDFGSRAVSLRRLGDALRDQGQLDDAIDQYRLALSSYPQFSTDPALSTDPNSAKAHNNLASALAERGDIPEAIEHLHSALRIAPALSEARENLETLLAHREAVLVRAQRELNRFRLELHLRPENWELRNDLAWRLATHSIEAARAPSEALALAEEAARATQRGDASVLDTLAAAHAAGLHFDRAVEVAIEARAIALAAGEHDLVAEIDRHLTSFRRGVSIVSAPSGSGTGTGPGAGADPNPRPAS